MKKLRLLGLFFGLVLVGPNLGWSQSCDLDGSDGGICCDQDFDGAGYNPAACFPYYGGAGFPAEGVNSDIDCGPITDPACSIPIDGGLSLLALAGGGLATAAMRRRREEEEAAAQGAA